MSAGVGTGAVAAPAAGLRRQGAVAAAVLVAVYLVVFGPATVLAVRALAGDLPAAPTGWQDRVAALEWDVFAVAVVWAVVVRWLPPRAPAVAARLGLRRPARLALPTVGYLGVAAVSAVLGNRVVAAAHLTSGANTQLGQGAGAFAVAAVASVSAAFTEELTLVALPVALLAGRRRWAVPATLATMLVLRLLPHLYYGWGSVFVVFWTLGAYALFRWSGSVWPLVLGHVAYDWAALGGHFLR